MGREVRRVPVDFDWPLHQVWEGFLNPHPYAATCAACGGTGLNPETRALGDRWYSHLCPENQGTVHAEEHGRVRELAKARFLAAGEPEGLASVHAELALELWQRRHGKPYDPHLGWAHHLEQADVDALVRGGRLMDLTHRFRRGKGWQARRAPERRRDRWCQLARKYERLALGARTAKRRARFQRRAADYRRLQHTGPISRIPAALVNEWSRHGFGHDGINQWICVKARAKRLGIYGHCPECDGGHVWASPAARELHESWEPHDPPEGEGWQVWETVSEGSPVSPVFSTGAELVEHLVLGGASRKAAEAFVLEYGWVPSGMTDGRGGFLSNIEVAGAWAEGGR